MQRALIIVHLQQRSKRSAVQLSYQTTHKNKTPLSCNAFLPPEKQPIKSLYSSNKKKSLCLRDCNHIAIMIYKQIHSLFTTKQRITSANYVRPAKMATKSKHCIGKSTSGSGMEMLIHKQKKRILFSSQSSLLPSTVNTDWHTQNDYNTKKMLYVLATWKYSKAQWLEYRWDNIYPYYKLSFCLFLSKLATKKCPMQL